MNVKRLSSISKQLGFKRGNTHLIEFHLIFSVDQNFLLNLAFDQNFFFSLDQISLDLFSLLKVLIMEFWLLKSFDQVPKFASYFLAVDQKF